MPDFMQWFLAEPDAIETSRKAFQPRRAGQERHWDGMRHAAISNREDHQPNLTR